jgi:hypothetical protein
MLHPQEYLGLTGGTQGETHDLGVIQHGIREVQLLIIVDKLEINQPAACHLRYRTEVVAVPFSTKPVWHRRVFQCYCEAELGRTVRLVQLVGVQARSRVYRVLPRNEAAVQAGDLVPAELCTGEMGIRWVIEALPQDVTRV